MIKGENRIDRRRKRHTRVRRKVVGTAERPRMALMVSNRHLYVQFIDDDRNVTLACASSQGDEGGNSVEIAGALGKRAAEAAQGKGIRSVVVDRGGFKFHGRVKAIVDSAVAAGLRVGGKEAK